MKTIRKNYGDWDASTKKRLMYATLSGGYLKRFAWVKPDSPTIVAFSQKQIMGWVFILSINGKNTVSTFVNERYRGKGVARYLIEQTLHIYPRIVLGQWNDSTKAFFRKLSEEHPGKIQVIDWWKNIGRYQKIVEMLQKQKKPCYGALPFFI